MRLGFTGLALLAAVSLSSIAQAQNGGTVIMRHMIDRVDGPGNASPPTLPGSGGSAQSPGIWVTGDWTYVDAGTCQADVVQTRIVTCMSAGVSVPNARCVSARPDDRRTVPRSTGCGVPAWTVGEWGDYSSVCSSTARRTRDVSCRDAGGNAKDDDLCLGAKPSSTEESAYYEGCTQKWVTGEWQQPRGCGAVDQERVVECVRSDGQVLGASACVGFKPAERQTGADYAQCSFDWSLSAWSDWTPACSNESTHVRTVTCMRQDQTAALDPGSCTATRPIDSETRAFFGGCTGTWSVTYANSTCSAKQMTQTPTVVCTKPDGVVDSTQASCNPNLKPSTAILTGSCTPTFQWQISAVYINSTLRETAPYAGKVALITHDGRIGLNAATLCIDTSTGRGANRTSCLANSGPQPSGAAVAYNGALSHPWTPDDTSLMNVTVKLSDILTATGADGFHALIQTSTSDSNLCSGKVMSFSGDSNRVGTSTLQVTCR